MSSRAVCQVAFGALPANMAGELIAGELRVMRRPAILHAMAAAQLGARLIGPFDLGEGGPGGWFILGKPELYLGGDVLIPDLAGWRRERMSVLPRLGERFQQAPDWTCVVLPRATADLDRRIRLEAYAREGVSHVWLVNPEARTLEALRLEGRCYATLGAYGGTACVRAEPFEVLGLELVALWG
jgi:Uma2 family endonuclease